MSRKRRYTPLPHFLFPHLLFHTYRERIMNKLRFATVGLAVLLAVASSAMAQNHYIGYVYPAGGQ